MSAKQSHRRSDLKLYLWCILQAQLAEDYTLMIWSKIFEA